MVNDKDVTQEQLDVIKKEALAREQKAESIVASAKQRNEEAEIQNLVWQMNSDMKTLRLAAVDELIKKYNANKTAISAAIELVTLPQLESLSASGRINVLVYLRNTDPTVWNEQLKSKAEDAIDEIRERSESGKTFIGPQTNDAINKFMERISTEAPHNN